MIRKIAAVIIGYLVMFLVVFACLTGAYLALGADKVFQPGSYEVTALWLIVWFLVSLGAALAGGKVCARIAKATVAVTSLAIVVLVFGILSALPALKTPEGEPKPRTSGPTNLEAMMRAKQPNWVLFLTPVIGVAGVVAGGQSVLRKK